MKPRTLIPAVGVVIFAIAACASRANRTGIMSYNVRNCVGMDNVLDYKRVADIIGTVNPDVVAVQELDSMTTRYPGHYTLGELARLTEMHATYAPAIDYRGGKYGIGILSKEVPLSRRVVSLPGTEEARVLLIVEFEKYFMGCTHLSLSAEDRLRSVAIIKEEAAQFDKPLFLAGDFNAQPDSDDIVQIETDFTVLSDISRSTFPASEPEVCIDYIMVYGRNVKSFDVITTEVIDEPVASDHRPITVTVRYK
jgi:endonuclease/exonuclease/phosphatase family metal-dependent hydrolase